MSRGWPAFVLTVRHLSSPVRRPSLFPRYCRHSSEAELVARFFDDLRARPMWDLHFVYLYSQNERRVYLSRSLPEHPS